MIWHTAFGVGFTGFNLSRVLNIHRVGETVMRLPKFGVLVPPLRLVLRLPSCKWTLSWAELLVLGAKGLLR